MESLMLSLRAVTPMMIYIFFGYFVGQRSLFGREQMSLLSKMLFSFFYPILLFRNTYRQDVSEAKLSVVLFAVAYLLFLMAILPVLVPKFEKDRTRIPVIIQGIYRSNAALFSLPIVTSIFGESAAVIVVVLLVFIPTIYNIYAAAILEYYRGSSVKIPVLLRNIVTNPMIAGTIAGVLFHWSGLPFPEVLTEPLNALANVATPLALFALGGTLDFSKVGRNRKTLSVTIALKLIAVPLAVFMISLLFPFTAAERFTILAMNMTPVATSSYPMAVSMGADGQLAAQLVVFSSVASLVTTFLWIFLLGQMGML